MSKLISFAVSESEAEMTPEQIENYQFTKVHFRIYSADAVNAHGYMCSLKILKKYSNTISGKPILAYYNKYANNGDGDFGGHEDSLWAQEIAVGFFPENCKVTYEKDENGTVFLCADGYIWNIYYQYIVDVFEINGGVKGVSSEMLVIDSIIDEETNIESILQYSFTGLTLLGTHDAIGNPIRPAVDGCLGETVKFSTKEEFEKAKIEFEKILYNSLKQESATADSFFISKNKEENMEQKNTQNSTSPDVVENAEQVVTTEVKVSTDTYTYGDNGEYLGNTYETHKKEVTEIVDVPDETNIAVNSDQEEIAATDTVENATGTDCVTNGCNENNSACKVNNSEIADLILKNETLEKTLLQKNSEYEILLQKCSELETYKKNKETELVKNSIECALNNVSHILNTTQIDDWRTKAEKYSTDNVDEFINKLKAFAFDVQDKNGIVQNESIRNSIPKVDVTESTDMWDRLSQKYI